MKFQTGDFFAIRGFGLVSRGIRLLTSIRYGIPFRETFSHVESAYDEKKNISAEADGVKILSNTRPKVTRAYAKVFRFKNFTTEDKANHKKKANDHDGIGYAFYRYALDAARIITFVLVLFWLFFTALDLLVGIIVGALIIFLILIKDFLKKKDKITEDCSETQSLIYSSNGRWYPLPNPRNEFPNGMVQVWENLVLNGVADVVAERQRGGGWVWKLGEETSSGESDSG